MTRIDRRQLLRAIGITPGWLPLLDAGRAHGATKPRRLIVIAVPNGVKEKVYWPTGTETDWQIAADSPLSPLLPHKNDIIFMGGIKLQNGWDSNKGSLGGHGSLPFLFTGKKGVPGPKISDDLRLSAGGPSVDVHIARELGKQNDFRFEMLPLLPFKHNDGNNDGFLSFRGPPIGGQIPNVPTPRHDPVELFNDVFGGGAGAGELAKLRAQRKSVLDFVGGYLGYMEKRLGTEDRRKLQTHADGIRTIEKQLAPVADACKRSPLPDAALDSNANNANAQIPAIIKTQIDITVAAMACDLTRVASMMWQDSGNVRWVWSWLGEEFTKPGTDFANNGENMGLRNHHEIAHRDSEPTYEPLMNRGCMWFIEQYAYLIARLKATPDVGGGSLFDSSVVLFSNMQRTGGGHHTDNLPWILAGSCDGYFKTGRFLPWPGGTAKKSIPQNFVLTGLCNAMGVPTPYFGDEEYGGELGILRG